MQVQQQDIEAQQNFTMDPSQYGANQTDTEYAEENTGIMSGNKKKIAFNKIAMGIAAFFGSAILFASLSSLFVCCNWGCKMPCGFCMEMCVKTSLWNVITLDACTFVPCCLCMKSDYQPCCESCLKTEEGPTCCAKTCVPTLFCTDFQNFWMVKYTAMMGDMAKEMMRAAMNRNMADMKAAMGHGQYGAQHVMNAGYDQAVNSMNSYTMRY